MGMARHSSVVKRAIAKTQGEARVLPDMALINPDEVADIEPMQQLETVHEVMVAANNALRSGIFPSTYSQTAVMYLSSLDNQKVPDRYLPIVQAKSMIDLENNRTVIEKYIDGVGYGIAANEESILNGISDENVIREARRLGISSEDIESSIEETHILSENKDNEVNHDLEEDEVIEESPKKKAPNYTKKVQESNMPGVNDSNTSKLKSLRKISKPEEIEVDKAQEMMDGVIEKFAIIDGAIEEMLGEVNNIMVENKDANRSAILMNLSKYLIDMAGASSSAAELLGIIEPSE